MVKLINKIKDYLASSIYNRIVTLHFFKYLMSHKYANRLTKYEDWKA